MLGQHHPGMTYNTGTPGLVRNTVAADGIGAVPFSSADSADVVIIDKPLNVGLTKSFAYSPLGLPPSTTPADEYPLVDAYLEATNQTASRVSELDIRDPAPGTLVADSVFDTLDLDTIRSITLPPGVPQSGVSVVLTLAGGGTLTTNYAEALALTPTDLADVVGIAVSAVGTIQTKDAVGLLLTFQLRTTQRTSGAPMTITDGPPDPVHVNTAEAEVTGPGGVGCAPFTTPCDNVLAEAEDEFQIVPTSYGMSAAKAIIPDVRVENQPRTGYVARLTGQPTGSARTLVLTLTDDDPRFWNAFDYAGLQPFQPVGPVNQLRLSWLTDVDYSLDDPPAPQVPDLIATCGAGGSTDLTACWTTGAWTGPDGSGQIKLALPGGVDPGTVRGVRIDARSVDANGVPQRWERPNNQRVVVNVDATRRVNLVWSPAGLDVTPVPSTLPGMTPAPGEPVQGTTNDELDVHGVATAGGGGTPLQADAHAAAFTRLLHLPNRIRVEKSPGSPARPPLYEPGSTVPYDMTITNNGSYTMTAPSFSVTDQIQTVGGVSPVTAPLGTGSFTFALFNAAGVSQPVTGIKGDLDEDTGLVTITFPTSPTVFTFPPGYRLVISAGLMVRPDLPAGTQIDNSVTATSDRDFERCQYTDDQGPLKTSGSLASPVSTCTATTTVQVRADTPLQITKLVRGDQAGLPGAAPDSVNEDDLGVLGYAPPIFPTPPTPDCAGAADAQGFYTYPCVPITRPGGDEQWRVDLENDGNVNASVVAGIDVLPSLGDQGVVVPTPRGSQWSPTLLNDFTSNLAALADGSAGTLSIYYSTTVPSTACNDADIRNSTRPGGLAPERPVLRQRHRSDLVAGDAGRGSVRGQGLQVRPQLRCAESRAERDPGPAAPGDLQPEVHDPDPGVRRPGLGPSRRPGDRLELGGGRHPQHRRHEPARRGLAHQRAAPGRGRAPRGRPRHREDRGRAVVALRGHAARRLSVQGHL